MTRGHSCESKPTAGKQKAANCQIRCSCEVVVLQNNFFNNRFCFAPSSDTYFIPVSCFLLFNVMDWAGRSLTAVCMWVSSTQRADPMMYVVYNHINLIRSIRNDHIKTFSGVCCFLAGAGNQRPTRWRFNERLSLRKCLHVDKSALSGTEWGVKIEKTYFTVELRFVFESGSNCRAFVGRIFELLPEPKLFLLRSVFNWTTSNSSSKTCRQKQPTMHCGPPTVWLEMWVCPYESTAKVNASQAAHVCVCVCVCV